MIRKSILITLILALTLTACGEANETGNPPAGDTPYPGPRYVPAPTVTPWYPEPAQGAATDVIMTSGFEPRAGDESYQRDKVTLDLTASTLTVEETKPVQASVILQGMMSDPCHKLRVAVTVDAQAKRIDLEVYSLVHPKEACITVIEPFSAHIPLGSFESGHYQVYVNGELLGEFDV